MYCKNCGKELKDDSKYCPHCGNKVDISNESEEKDEELSEKDKKNLEEYQRSSSMNNTEVVVWIGLALVVVIFIIIGLANCMGCSDSSDSNETEKVDSTSIVNNLNVGTKEWLCKTKKSMEENNNYLKSSTFSFKGDVDNRNMSLNIDEILNVKNGYNKEEIKYINSDKTLSKLYKENCLKANSVLKIIMPNYRKKFSSNLHKTLWSKDIYVSSNNKSLSLTGAFFAKNANIEMVYNMIVEDASHFGFTKIIFRWYNGQDDFQYYTIKSEIKY